MKESKESASLGEMKPGAVCSAQSWLQGRLCSASSHGVLGVSDGLVHKGEAGGITQAGGFYSWRLVHWQHLWSDMQSLCWGSAVVALTPAGGRRALMSIRIPQGQDGADR